MTTPRTSSLVDQREFHKLPTSSTSFRRTPWGFWRRSLWGSALLFGAGALTTSCGSEEKGGKSTQVVEVPVNPPCENTLKAECGKECEEDKDCRNGLYCDANKCTAQCTVGGGQCEGTCSPRGRCDGDIRMQPVETLPDIDGPIIAQPTSTNGGGGVGAACATGSATATLSNINMFLMFDQSSSMRQNNRWQNAQAALTAFLRAPESGGIKIALRFFGSDEPVAGCNIDDCSVEACSQPLIDLGELKTETGAADPHEQALVEAIESREPNPVGLGTPILAALDGAVSWAENFTASAPEGERAVVVFVTDGQPSGCGNATNTIAAVAARGARNGVMTFTVGLQGSSEEQLNAIARQGGTGSGIFVGDGNAQEDLLEALNAIRGRALACDFPLPTGQNVDPRKINVTFTADSGESQQWNKVDNEGACGNNNGWYFDDPSDPSSVILCPTSCETASSKPEAKLEVILGCETNAPLAL